MRHLLKMLDPFQIIGFIISTAISMGMILSGQDTIQSVSLGLILAVLVQQFDLFDLQMRLTESKEHILEAGKLTQKLYRDELLLEEVKNIVNDYLQIKSGWFGLFKRRADGAITECRNILHLMAEGYTYADLTTPFTLGANEYN